jgi:hypothetical protein
MTNEPERANADAEPTFADVWPDLAIAGELLEALAKENYDAIEELKSTDTDWWNVAWTLALLLKGLRAGDETTVKLVDDLMSGQLGAAGET